ncbi:MAG: hypothetical protein N3A57_05820 [Negativicutes bacterium]|nr:hypothetical protein [Negativicutes bacterium]
MIIMEKSSGKITKVLLIPLNYYLSYGAFLNIAAALRKHENVEAILMVIRPLHKSWEENVYNAERFARDNLQIATVRLFGQVPRKNNRLGVWDFVRKSLNAAKLLLNVLLLAKFMLRMRPDAIVINSDLGDFHVRVIQKVCLQLNIAIFIVHNIRNVGTETTLRKSGRIEKIFRYPGTVIGSYTSKSVILSATDDFKREIVEQGISEARVIVVGDPREIPDTPSFSRAGVTRRDRGISVVYYTEVIQERYGYAYVLALHNWLGESFARLLDIEGVRIFVKLHPREIEYPYLSARSDEIFSLYGIACLECGEKLAKMAGDSRQIAVGHNTDMLRQAARKSIPVIGIDYLGDLRFSMFGDYYGRLTVGCHADLVKELRLIIEDEESYNLRSRMSRAWVFGVAYEYWMDAGISGARGAENIANVIVSRLRSGGCDQ